MFLLNSRLGRFSAPRLCSGGAFSRSYSTILPSSLAMYHSSTLGFSPQPPVSVYGTGIYGLKLRGFSWKHDYADYPLGIIPRGTIRFDIQGGFACPEYIYTLQRTIPSVRAAVTSPSPHRSHIQYWNINQLSIDFTFRLRLRTRLTLIRLALIRKPWLFGVRVSRPHYRYLCLHLRFQPLQIASQLSFCAMTGMLPYHLCALTHKSTASVICLCPFIIHAGSLDQ